MMDIFIAVIIAVLSTMLLMMIAIALAKDDGNTIKKLENKISELEAAIHAMSVHQENQNIQMSKLKEKDTNIEYVIMQRGYTLLNIEERLKKLEKKNKKD
jgi:septal ring factor EnvC (AmiA/AmiB activator)